MNEKKNEDRVILKVLQIWESADLTFGRRPGETLDEASETLLRLYTELGGLLPYGVEPVEPSAELRKRILAAVSGEETQPVPGIPPREEPKVVHFRRPEPAEVRPPKTSRWFMAVAALLAISLSAVSGWLYLRLEEQERTIIALQEELRQASARQEELARVRLDMDEISRNFAVFTSPGVEVCPLRPAGDAPPQPRARGVLYVSPDRTRWYVRIQGLEPEAPGQDYQLWFFVNETPTSAGVFTVAQDGGVQIMSDQIPANMTAVAVTLEPMGGASRPTGQMVLYGDEKMDIL